eukprot:TRINITY_DN4686_c0_g2_i2.p2 TRINITY_DN4686_c0_g2~~TRINITY_DN4686_c0_g2_i2.p2  ORF type:complete len:134 (-),score=22.88 TRINITY_DN4686_c0_g2_i2:590-991(-)
MRRVTQRINDWITNQITVYDDKPAVEVTLTVGPCADQTELVTRFATDFATGRHFWGDEYGMESYEHEYNELWGLEGSFYPMVANAFMRDAASDRQLTLFAAHSHGAASLADGALELMLARRGNGECVLPLASL